MKTERIIVLGRKIQQPVPEGNAKLLMVRTTANGVVLSSTETDRPAEEIPSLDSDFVPIIDPCSGEEG
jgi:hypothetical protein